MQQKMRELPVQMVTADLDGNIQKVETAKFKMMPPRPDACQVCATKHDPRLPHNAQSMYYQYAFFAAVGRWPTWADACAHCDDAMRTAWRGGLEQQGAKWTEPPEGWPPIKHLGEQTATPDPAGAAAEQVKP
jgi:hypothetical protein